ncbi:SdpI family protein [Rubripirellula reticaptiva]|uniref:SdpI family protein n=1 Tax=Rubripirellula reticaptiva TaxID=2528013 RepID=A0A5C6F8B7_9BACT|nr:SdpI family protein [Rubripirellula reticaptiva]TWU56366.1 hypothetical protein Poly59_26700 [Rubripirellula reticaptiva]
MILIASTLFLSGFLMTGACLPLVFGKVPMNSVDGIRIKTAYRSPDSWMYVNEVGGMIFAMLRFPLMLAGAIGSLLTDREVAVLGIVAGLSTLGSLTSAVYLLIRYTNSYSLTFDQTTCKSKFS